MKVLLFDVDGTLIRARGAGRKALGRALRALWGREPELNGDALAGRTDPVIFEEAARRVLGRRPVKAELNRMRSEYLRRLPSAVRATVRAKKYGRCRGVGRLLDALKSRPGVLLGLGTGNLELGARIKLEPSGLNPYFRFGGFGSDGVRRETLLKTAVRRAAALAGGRAIRPREVFVIGDTPLDVAAGKKAGYRTIAVGTGFSDWEDLVRARPDRLARDFTRVSEWLSWIGQ